MWMPIILYFWREFRRFGVNLMSSAFLFTREKWVEWVWWIRTVTSRTIAILSTKANNQLSWRLKITKVVTSSLLASLLQNMMRRALCSFVHCLRVLLKKRFDRFLGRRMALLLMFVWSWIRKKIMLMCNFSPSMKNSWLSNKRRSIHW